MLRNETTIFIEKGNITSKMELEEIGWSCLDASSVYRATVTEFSIPDGIISVHTKIVNADGSEYKLPYYRNSCHDIVPVT